MIRVQTCAVVTVCMAPLALIAAEDKPSIYTFETSADLSYISASGYPSWTQGSVGKLRYDGSIDGLLISRAFADYRLRVADTVDASVVAQLYMDEIGPVLDVTEAFLEWRPLPDSRNRYRLKAGAFHPRVSLENTGAGWDSPYTINPSVINTWIAEEYRVFGAEASISRRAPGGAHNFSLQFAVFRNNDPAGSLLAWRGWAVHNRQSRFSDALPLPPLPQIQPGMLFESQDPYVAPFREIDNRFGYYVNAEWRFGDRLLLRAMHYDNRADPTVLQNGQYAWQTAFDHIGAQASLPAKVGLIVQWLKGAGEMGPLIDGARAVDFGYDSNFILLTKTFTRHRISARYDHFEVSDNDNTFEDNNSEYGHAWTFAYQYEASDFATLAVEWLEIETFRDAWEYFGLENEKTERQLQVSLRLSFSSGS